jgi:hypothetical protein
MSNVFFTAIDGTVWINKSHLKKVIAETYKDLPYTEQCQQFADLINGYLDACHHKDQDVNISNPDVDYFYCGGCRKGFPVKYTPEMERPDIRPCPICGAQSNVTPKIRQGEKTNEKDNTESS